MLIELGSGASFAKQVIPELITSDVLPYDGVDMQLDATKMPFNDGSVRAIFLLNVFHHIDRCADFLAEPQRVLAPGGKLLIIDQNVGPISYWMLRYLHHEGFDAKTRDWHFLSTGPLSSANGALAWIVFRRDLRRFQEQFPRLNLKHYAPFSPLQYWISGGLKFRPPFGKQLVAPIRVLDQVSLKLHGNLGSFVEIELDRSM